MCRSAKLNGVADQDPESEPDRRLGTAAEIIARIAVRIVARGGATEKPASDADQEKAA